MAGKLGGLICVRGYEGETGGTHVGQKLLEGSWGGRYGSDATGAKLGLW